MTFVTRLTLRSGDRVVLDETVEDIRAFVARKGAEFKGPHPRPPTTVRAPLWRRLGPDGKRFPPWTYTVYSREMEIVGYDAVARAITERAFPGSIHVSVEVEQIRSSR